MASVSTWVMAARPKTLPAAVAPVLLGTGLAFADGQWQPVAALICLGFALLVQIGTNFANDYLDFQKGADKDRQGPTRAVAAGLISVGAMRSATFVVLAAAFCLGLGLIPFGGWWLLAVGIASVACAWLYTGGPYPLAYNGLGDVFVVLFFGLIAVGCSYYVQFSGYSWDVFLVGLGCGGLVNNILVVNNYRDAEKDALVGKRTLIVILGRGAGLAMYAEATIWASLVPFWLLWRGYGAAVLLGLLPALAGLALTVKLHQAGSARDFGRMLGLSSGVVAAYGVLLTIGLVV